MKKERPIVAPGVDVDPRLVVRELGHDPRDQPHAETVQLVGDAVREDRLHARIGEDELVEPLGRRVPVVGRLDVLRDTVGNLGEPLEQGRHDLSRVPACGRTAFFGLDRPLDLGRKAEVDPEEDVAEMVSQVVAVEDRVAEVARVDDLLEQPEDLDDVLLLRAGSVVDRGELRTGLGGGDDARDRAADPVLRRTGHPFPQAARRARASSCALASSTGSAAEGTSATRASSIRLASGRFSFS